MIAVPYRDGLPDALADAVAPPQKWFRLNLVLPSFEFTPQTAEADAKEATDKLNKAIEAQITAWAASSDEPYGGRIW